jgi:hypothetical protein
MGLLSLRDNKIESSNVNSVNATHHDQTDDEAVRKKDTE